MSPSHSPDPSLIEKLVITASAYPSDRTTPQAFVLAVGTRAFSVGIEENDLGLFLKKQTASHPGLSDLLANRSAYRRLVSSARSAALSSSPAGADQNALRTARVTMGRILSPIEVAEGETPLSAVRQIRARVALAILANEQLKSIRSDQGWNTIMVSYAWLALRMGASWPTAKAALNDLVGLGWIRELAGSRPDSARRFKISSGRLTRSQGQVIEPDHLYQAIGLLAQLNDATNRVTELIRVVAHPAWSYGPDPLGQRTWLLALASAAGVDPVQLGVGSRYIPKARKALEVAGLWDTTSLREPLDEWAERTSAFEAASQAKALYKENAAQRTDELAMTRALRAQAKKDAEAFFGPTSSIPAAGSSRDRMNAWLEGATGVMGRKVLADAQIKAMDRELGKRFKARGYEGDTVTKLTAIVVSAAGSLIGPEDSIPAAADEPATKQEWLQAMVEKVAARPLANELRAAAGQELVAKLKRRGFEKEKARQLAEIVLSESRPHAA